MLPLVVAFSVWLSLSAGHAFAQNPVVGNTSKSATMHSNARTAAQQTGLRPEAQEALRATLAIEAKLAEGMTYQGYAQAVIELNTSFAELSVALDEQDEVEIQELMTSIRGLHQNALSFWSACLRSPPDCPDGQVRIFQRSPTEAGAYGSKILAKRLVHGAKKGQSMPLDTVLNEVWTDCRHKGMLLRALLRP